MLGGSCSCLGRMVPSGGEVDLGTYAIRRDVIGRRSRVGKGHPSGDSRRPMQWTHSLLKLQYEYPLPLRCVALITADRRSRDHERVTSTYIYIPTSYIPAWGQGMHRRLVPETRGH